MAMSTGNSGGVKSEINVTPLVDVMLVLLIIFMITAPLLSHKIPVDLAVKEDGSMYLNDNPISEAELKVRFAAYAGQAPQPELQIRAARSTQYKIVRKILGDAKDAGMVHVGFITREH